MRPVPYEGFFKGTSFIIFFSFFVKYGTKSIKKQLSYGKKYGR